MTHGAGIPLGKRETLRKTPYDPLGGQFAIFSLGDALVQQVYPQRFRTFSKSIEILGVSATAGFGFGPTGSNIVLDLVTGSTADTLWPSNPGNRPTILAGNQETVAETVPDLTIVAGGTSIRAKAVSIGSTLPGSYVVLAVRWRWVP